MHMHKVVGRIISCGLLGRDKLTRPSSTPSPISGKAKILQEEASLKVHWAKQKERSHGQHRVGLCSRTMPGYGM
jgi:hypothetical protein